MDLLPFDAWHIDQVTHGQTPLDGLVQRPAKHEKSYPNGARIRALVIEKVYNAVAQFSGGQILNSSKSSYLKWGRDAAKLLVATQTEQADRSTGEGEGEF